MYFEGVFLFGVKMLVDRGFKFKDVFYDKSLVDSMTYDDVENLISNVETEIKSASEYIFPYSEKLKARSKVPDSVKRKLLYKDACIHFQRDLKEELKNKKIDIERAFFRCAFTILDTETYNLILEEAKKI
jgi:hypothetical protein